MKAKTGASLKATITRKRYHPYIKMTYNYRNQTPKRCKRTGNYKRLQRSMQCFLPRQLSFSCTDPHVLPAYVPQRNFFDSDFATGSLGPHLSLGPSERRENCFFFTFSVRPIFLDNSTIVHTDVSAP